ncbi:MAG: DUF2806 domain-containing protein [Gammaproteobacteria bacterium]|nr:DUF2806 domain-containing protein [Gammaproteobacteria bacterium]
MDDDNPPEDGLGEKFADLGRAIAPFVPKFPNLRKVQQRLLGDVPDAAFGALVARLRLSQARSQSEAITTLVERTGLPPAVAYEMVTKQERLDGLVGPALARIAHDPDPSTESTQTDAVTDDDWFEVYRREAADRGEGEMRAAFIRVLEGEIRKPGTFSVHALRILGTISTRTAERFRRAASVAISKDNDTRVPAVNGGLGNNCLRDIGLSYDVLTELTENGLVRPDYGSRMPYGPIHEATSVQELPPNLQLPFQHQSRWWALVGTTEETKVKALRVQGAAFTVAGRELLSVVDLEPLPEFTERLKAHFVKSKYEMREAPAGRSFFHWGEPRPHRDGQG